MYYATYTGETRIRGSLPSVSADSVYTIMENDKSCNGRLWKVPGSLEKEELKAGELKKRKYLS